MQLTVATYNIHGCVGNDRRYAPARTAEVLLELKADVIALQEVDDRLPRSEGLEQFEYLLQASGYQGVAGPTLRDHRGHFGNAVLSRFPIESVRRVDLSVPRFEPRGALDVLLRTPDGGLRVVATHLGLRARERKTQIKRLLEDLHRPQKGRTHSLLLGDFNEWLPLEGPRLRPIAAQFASRLAGPSFPSWRPLFNLDRIYAFPAPDRSETAVHRSETARSASDHLPVKAWISWSST